MSKIKAIETNYKGYRFRSRLEARWAVFFDALKIQWSYEHEGFDLGAAGYYLPDFWLPELQEWVEIKPLTPTTEELTKAHALRMAFDTWQDVWILAGEPWIEWSQSGQFFLNSRYRTWCGDNRSASALWTECFGCGRIQIRDAYDGQLQCMHCDCVNRDWNLAATKTKGWQWHKGFWIWDKGFGTDARITPRLRQAYEASRSARFEHGESGTSPNTWNKEKIQRAAESITLPGEE